MRQNAAIASRSGVRVALTARRKEVFVLLAGRPVDFVGGKKSCAFGKRVMENPLISAGPDADHAAESIAPLKLSTHAM